MTQNSPSGGIPRKSLTSAVAEKLREKIVRGDIREGEQLRQDAIAQEFQVSRIPVREALRQLEAEGVITIVPHRGAVVSLLSCDEIEELFEMRAILEPEVLRVSIPNLTDSDFAQAANVLDTYDAALRNEGNVAEWGDRKSTRLNSSHVAISYAVFCLKKKKKTKIIYNTISHTDISL